MIVRLLLLAAFVGLVFWLLRWFRSTPPERVARVLRKSALWGAVAILIIAVLSGRLNPIFAAIGAAIPLVLRAANLLRLVPALQQILRSLGLGGALGAAGGGPGAQASSIRTRYLDMRLDHATGALDGTVLDGPFKGRELSALGLDELLRMHELYRESDGQSLAVLEAYLDREHGEDWRERAQTNGGSGGAPARTGELSEAEARSILGVEHGADAEAVRAAHRRLMQRLHPDRGGSDYLAAKINEARRRLIGD
ncbi:molecular chaperone DnaJ [Thiorhodococcus minor]|uniref:molecular chaperone DnaJ n=1 Tax=Thiorhodococcus minor TaxID=57489 RepID=UPI001ADBE551|nr:molecular chaperone DnaJ [Thiorhodococcus minor]